MTSLTAGAASLSDLPTPGSAGISRHALPAHGQTRKEGGGAISQSHPPGHREVFAKYKSLNAGRTFDVVAVGGGENSRVIIIICTKVTVQTGRSPPPSRQAAMQPSRKIKSLLKAEFLTWQEKWLHEANGFVSQ